MSNEAAIRSGRAAPGGSRSARAPRRRRNGLWAALATALAVLAVAPASALAGELDQSQENWTGGSGLGGSQQKAQTFTAGKTGELDRVDLPLVRGGSPGPLTVAIHAVDGAGHPTGEALASEELAEQAVPTSFDWVEVPFDVPAPSAAGTKYAIVLAAPGGSPTGAPEYAWAANPARITEGDSYGGGQALLSTDGGGTWFASTGEGTRFFTDHAFKTYVDPGAPFDPAEAIDELIDEVEGLEGISPGIKQSLVAKLDGALKNLDQDDTAGACEKLASFSAQVAALSGKKFDAGGLIAAAEEIRGQLGCEAPEGAVAPG